MGVFGTFFGHFSQPPNDYDPQASHIQLLNYPPEWAKNVSITCLKRRQEHQLRVRKRSGVGTLRYVFS